LDCRRMAKGPGACAWVESIPFYQGMSLSCIPSILNVVEQGNNLKIHFLLVKMRRHWFLGRFFSTSPFWFDRDERLGPGRPSFAMGSAPSTAESGDTTRAILAERGWKKPGGSPAWEEGKIWIWVNVG
jgi:hypothetical protein